MTYKLHIKCNIDDLHVSVWEMKMLSQSEIVTTYIAWSAGFPYCSSETMGGILPLSSGLTVLVRWLSWNNRHLEGLTVVFSEQGVLFLV